MSVLETKGAFVSVCYEFWSALKIFGAFWRVLGAFGKPFLCFLPFTRFIPGHIARYKTSKGQNRFRVFWYFSALLNYLRLHRF